MTHPKFMKFIDKGYLQWIREKPSIVSGYPPPSDPHHLFNTGKKGKRNDYLEIPLTREDHTEIHTIGHDTFEEKHCIDLMAEAFNLLSRYINDKECT